VTRWCSAISGAGAGGVSGNCGYWIAERARGRGFASAALALLSEWALGPPLGLARLALHIDIENEVSQRVAINAGFAFEGLLRSYMCVKGRRWDVARYSRLAGEARP
jgi:RimJ/RimL family protein N-acetyltransferase